MKISLRGEMKTEGLTLSGDTAAKGSKRRSGGGTKRCTFQLKREPALPPPPPIPIKQAGDGKLTRRRKKQENKKKTGMLKQAKAARRDGRRETNASISGRRRTKGSRAAAKLTQTNKFAFDKNHSRCFCIRQPGPRTRRRVCRERAAR